MEILCFFAGVALFCLKSGYPVCFLFVVLIFFNARLRILAWFLAGMAWSLCHQWWVADDGMPGSLVIQDAALQGHVASIPTHTASKTQFQFLVKRLNHQPVHARVLLSCYNRCPDFRAGEYWQIHAKLQQPQNLANPGGFDYVKGLASRHIRWTGYVRRGMQKRMNADSNRYLLLALRENMARALEALDPNEQTLGILQALTLGVTSHINKADWDLFRRTGTTHLMVISGAHIGLIAGLAYGFVKWLWCRFGRLCLWCPAQKIASIGALTMGAIYALLAGFGVPAQRALWVCFFMLLHRFCSQRVGIWQAWRYALFAVLIFEPHSVMMPGFYLSFIAVAILILVNQRFPLTGIRKTLWMQLACLVGLMPLTLYFFSYGAVNGMLANALAIPWVSFIIVPIGLLTTLLGHWFVLPLQVSLLTGSIEYLIRYLHWVDALACVNLNVSYAQFLSPLALMVSIYLLVLLPMIRFMPILLMTAVAGIFPAHERIKQGTARIDVMDVGQGLAVVVNTAHHTLIYDTGVQFYQGGDMGERVVVPYLKTMGIKAVDKVVISHPDLDHRGGLASLEAAYPIHELIVDNPAFYKRGFSCHQYPDWEWDGVLFHFFAIKTALKSKNNSSCVLRISTQGGSVLLSGDIERLAEDDLVSTHGHQLAASVLVVPH
ncbi:MAG TPA: DNA internalization-related competence protein ComEC/Rec2, partial [Legionella sp.]|nr:DNA internalization-related competence protein ComEC/Rec2 [Legionella sp.]